MGRMHYYSRPKPLTGDASMCCALVRLRNYEIYRALRYENAKFKDLSARFGLSMGELRDCRADWDMSPEGEEGQRAARGLAKSRWLDEKGRELQERNEAERKKHYGLTGDATYDVQRQIELLAEHEEQARADVERRRQYELRMQRAASNMKQ